MTSEDRADDALAGERPADQGRTDDNRAAQDRADEDRAAQDRASEGEDGLHPRQDGPHPRDDLPQLDLNDPKAMRALAHPLRWALLEALGHAGTLTATQASEMLGESPANCAFHLRTLAKYGFVEEAGGGKGRERPWRRAYGRMSWHARQGDEQFRLAGQALNQVWLDRVLSRARRSLAATTSWPEGFEDDLGGSTSMFYVTPEEARKVHAELMKTFERTIGQEHRFAERRDPARRPPGAVPVEFVLLAYPILDAPPLPRAGQPVVLSLTGSRTVTAAGATAQPASSRSEVASSRSEVASSRSEAARLPDRTAGSPPGSADRSR
jgi:predicted transcriptional regulator